MVGNPKCPPNRKNSLAAILDFLPFCFTEKILAGVQLNFFFDLGCK
jgi:hypothetical protein